MLSAAEAIRGAYQAIDGAGTEVERASAETWLNELIWREFYINILHHFPYVRDRSFRPVYDSIAWINDAADFDSIAPRLTYP